MMEFIRFWLNRRGAAFTVLLLALTAAYSPGTGDEPATTLAPMNQATEQPSGTDEGFWRSDWQATGEQVYWRSCAGCHFPEGEGALGIYPGLRNNATVNSSPAQMLMPVMFGRGAMPGFSGELNDAEIAAVVSYIRSSWGNTGTPISPGQVAVFRQEDSEVVLDPFSGEH